MAQSEAQKQAEDRALKERLAAAIKDKELKNESK